MNWLIDGRLCGKGLPAIDDLMLTLAVNSIAFGGLLLLLSAGFSLIFGPIRIPNLMHGSLFMFGACFDVTLLAVGANFWVAALASAAVVETMLTKCGRQRGNTHPTRDHSSSRRGCRRMAGASFIG